MSHTKEPWSQVDGYVTAADGHIVADCETTGLPKTEEANARRIVACVNLCSGIAIEQLEAAVFLSPLLPEGLKEKAIDFAEMKKQRDALLRAFNQAMAKVESATSCHPNAVRYLLDEALEIWGKETAGMQEGGAA